MADFLVADVEGEDPCLPAELHYRFYYRRQLLEPSEYMVKLFMNGGETVYAKVASLIRLGCPEVKGVADDPNPGVRRPRIRV
jgi:hypothetical protein